MSAEGKEWPPSYSDLLRHAPDQLSEEALGRKLVEHTAKASTYSCHSLPMFFVVIAELIGILNACTAKTMLPWRTASWPSQHSRERTGSLVRSHSSTSS